MFPKKNRLSRKEFEKVFNKGKSIHTDYFVILYARDQALDKAKAGVVSSTKVSKKATERNKAKRKLRELIRAKLSKLKDNLFIVGICKKELLESEFKEVEKVLENIFKTKGFYK